MSFGDLLDACAVVVGEAPNDLPGIDIARKALELRTANEVDATCDPVVAPLLDEALGTPTGTSDRRLAELVRACAGDLHWYTAYPDHDEPDMLALRAGYFVATLVDLPDSRMAPATSPDARIFVTIQAPRLTYPSHVHKAPELYHVIAGEALWQKGGRAFAPRSPGDWIVHPTGTRHAMQTFDQPLLAMAMWTSDLESRPVIVRD